MRNRAKCKLCNDLIESFHRHDYVACGCGEISLVGGLDYLGCGAKNWCNFLRVDDEGKEITVQVVEKREDIAREEQSSVLELIEGMIKGLEGLPQTAMETPITHYDFHSILLLLRRMTKENQ